MTENIIEVKNLEKIYKSGSIEVKAVKAISFLVAKGEIFGFLGPNGAGKTTTLHMLSTLLFPTSGTATIAGYDISKEPDLVRKNIGMVFQETSLDIDLTGRENLELHAIMYGLDKETRETRIDEMLKIVELTDKTNVFVKNYTGGMKRRLEIARGLLHYPKCLFLDEPTIGLDPQTRRAIWEHIKKLNQKYGITIILTTHYMEEADALCDRICIIDHGDIIALDTNENLKAQLKGDIISLEFEDHNALHQFKLKIKNYPGINAIKEISPKKGPPMMGGPMMGMKPPGIGGKPHMMGGTPPAMSGKPPLNAPPMDKESLNAMMQMMSQKATKMNITIENGSEKVPDLIKIANDAGIKIKSLTISQPSLEDVFIHYTGRSIREEEGHGMNEFVRQMIQARMRSA
ncbi:MAG TPA: ATP-binding cassette domain-containing protein [Candidatus Deferrimicrobium sp.]|nr:ATP-binding cassette domain-containing protein [Candidatus Deferrimicrobium sp.]